MDSFVVEDHVASQPVSRCDRHEQRTEALYNLWERSSLFNFIRGFTTPLDLTLMFGRLLVGSVCQLAPDEPVLSVLYAGLHHLGLPLTPQIVPYPAFCPGPFLVRSARLCR